MSEHGHHIIPYKVYYVVFGALIFLTIVTVVTAQIDLGVLNVPLALLIAGTKATLVVMFFMALKYDNKVNILVFGVGMLFVVVFLGFTMLDTEFRGTFDPIKEGTVSDRMEIVEQQQARSDQIQAMVGTPSDAAATDSAATEDGESVPDEEAAAQ